MDCLLGAGPHFGTMKVSQGQMMAKSKQQVKGLNPGSRVLDFKVANPMYISVPQ